MIQEYEVILKNAGVKLTRPRRLVLDVLCGRGEPLSIKEIHKQSGKKADLASIYRTIGLFTELGITREVPLGEGYQRYELVEQGKHRHYVLCVKCGTIRKIDICILEQIEKLTNFKIISHSMEFRGICSKCSS
jgi:Fur family transcriptional regulator, ferric uptake regulator